MIEVIIIHILKNIKNTFVAVLLIKLCVLMINLANQLFFMHEKNTVNHFIKSILKENGQFKQTITNHLVKMLSCLQKMKEDFSQVINANDLKLTKNIYNLKGYDSHLIMQQIGKFNIIISVLPNGLEKCMAFTINKNLVFIDSMQFMNSSQNTLVKNL